MSLTVLLAAASVLVPVPQPLLDGWTGQMVMLKHSRAVCRPVNNLSNQDRLTLIEYRVVQDNGDEIVVIENGKEMVVQKEDLVLQVDAIAFYSEAIQRDPADAALYAFRGWAHKQQKSLENAVADYDRAIELAPGQCAWRNNRALIRVEQKEYDRAIVDYNVAINLYPQYSLAYRNRGNCRLKQKEYDGALADFQKSVEFGPEVPLAQSTLARLLATCPDNQFRNAKQAVEAARKACEISNWKIGTMLDTLAAAYAEAGQFDEAVRYEERAFADPEFVQDKQKVVEARKCLQLYRNKKPYREEE
jgi:tetratricopeptide (TPR) repeat protein